MTTSWRGIAARARRVPARLYGPPLRTTRWLVGASRAHGAPLPRVALRAARLHRRGWHVGDLAMLGLLDPVEGPERERWAVRRSEFLDLQRALNPPAAVRATEDKRTFTAICREQGIPTPRLLAVLERRAGPGASADEWASILRRAAPDELVVKPNEGQLAEGVRILRRTPDGVVDAGGRTLSWERLAQELAHESWPSYVVQQRLHPHPELLRLSGADVLQCLRIVTLVEPGGDARVLYSVLRIAAGDVAVDSFRAARSGTTGNLLARLEDDGRLARPVAVAPGGFGLVRVDDHPVTGIRLTGAAVPDWDAARDVALRAARAFAEVRTVGWDVAPTPDGPVVVEGNAWWGASGDPDGALLPVRAALVVAATSGASRSS